MERREAARLVTSTIESRGWVEIILPALNEKRSVLIAELLSSDSYERFVEFQQAICAIDNLILFLDEIVKENTQSQ